MALIYSTVLKDFVPYEGEDTRAWQTREAERLKRITVTAPGMGTRQGILTPDQKVARAAKKQQHDRNKAARAQASRSLPKGPSGGGGKIQGGSSKNNKKR